MITVSFCNLGFSVPVFAYTEYDYEDAGFNFLKIQYQNKNIEYDNICKQDVFNLYGVEDRVVAKLMVVNRDGVLDYVVLDFIVDRIDEFGFDQEQFVNRFYNKDKIFYAGTLKHAYYNDNILYDIYDNEIKKDVFFNELEFFCSYEPPETLGTGLEGGIISYNEIQQNIQDRSSVVGTVENTSWKYLKGFGWGNVGSWFNFFSQTDFNNYFNSKYGTAINGTCAVVALTDISVYLNYRGYSNALVNGNEYDTFESLLTYTNWFNWKNYTYNDQWYYDVLNGYTQYLKDKGYSPITDHYVGSTFRDFEISINNDRPIWTYICHKSSLEAHAVMTVGYETYKNTYRVNEKYWLFGWHDNWKTYTYDFYYLRVVDGWDTSNDARFIDYNGYYSVVSGIDFGLI